MQKPSIILADLSHADCKNTNALSEQPLCVNMEYLSEIINCDEELKRELVEIYLRQMTEDLGKLKEAFAIQNSEDIKRFAHRMVGGSAACGMTTLVDSLRELECLAEAGNLSKILPALLKVENDYKRVDVFLREMIPSSGV